MPETVRPCEYCGTPVAKTGKQQSQRKYWTCKGGVCANKLRIQLGHTPGWKPNPYRGQKETRLCAECGVKPVTRYLNLTNINQRWTCSHKCMGKQQTSRILADGRMSGGKKPRRGDWVPCKVCGVEFYRQPAYIKQGRFLHSTECNKIWQARNQVTKICEHCGIEFKVPPSKVLVKYHNGSCESRSKIKRPTGREHNGRPVIQNSHGYLTVYEPTHPAASKSGRVLEHRLIMEQHLGRFLTTDEQVDHINQNKTDNRVENFQLMAPAAHTVKTNGDRKRRELSMAERLALYEQQFGPLAEVVS